MPDYEGVSPEAALLATQGRHVLHVQEFMLLIRQELERRALVHDRSKLSPEEFPGFARINATARRFPYGSEEYKASLRAERPTIDLHTLTNTHHPEAHRQRGLENSCAAMPWLDLIEMVCDWRAAWVAYGQQGTWEQNIQKQRERFGADFTEGQWWLIDQVSAWLDLR